MYKILIVEDDATIAGVMARHLREWGYEVQCAEDFEKVLQTFHAFAPQLVLLDLSLPYRGGFHWCAEIRKTSKVPILFVTSAADNMNLVTALHQGADDFVAKPFDLAVLVAKVQALLRRTYDFAAPADLLAHGDAVLNLSDSCLYVGETKVDLTRNEFRILQMLMEGKGRIVSRETIMRRLWDDESFIDDNTLTVNIARLRKKLEEAGLDDFVQTKKGQGYRVPAQQEESSEQG